MLDDLNDHWTCDEHLLEQLSFLRLLHEVVTTLPSAITILSGDVHTSCVQELQAALDGRALLVNIVSSGVRHTPMPSAVASIMQTLPCQRDLPLGEERWNIVSRRWQKVRACSPANTISSWTAGFWRRARQRQLLFPGPKVSLPFVRTFKPFCSATSLRFLGSEQK